MDTTKPRIDPTKGDEGDETGAQPDQEAKAEAGQAEGHAVEDAEQQTDGRLAAHESRNGAVNVVGDGTDGVRMLTGQPAIDLGDHVVPIEQDVEGDDGGHYQNADDAEKGLPARPQRSQEAAGDRSSLPEQVAERFFYVGQALAHQVSEPAAADLRKDPLQRGDIGGNAFLEAGNLVAEERHEQDRCDEKDEDEGQQDDRPRRPARQAEPFQPVRDRVEEIGERQAGDEGQKDAAQEP
jgi:hypothetical protein